MLLDVCLLVRLRTSSYVLQTTISCGSGWTETDRVRETTLGSKMERGAPAELERPIVRVRGMLSGQERQAVTTGANEHVTHLMSGCSYRWARLQCA